MIQNWLGILARKGKTHLAEIGGFGKSRGSTAIFSQFHIVPLKIYRHAVFPFLDGLL